MRIKQKISLALVGAMMCTLLSGCMASTADIVITENGSGTIEASVGLTKEALLSMHGAEELNDEMYENTFVYNDVTYYGETKKGEFKNFEELNTIMNDSEKDGVDTGIFNISKTESGDMTLILHVTPETGDTSAINEEIVQMDDNLTEEEAEALLDSMVVVYSFTFPNDITQTKGEKTGITIDKNKITFDFIALGKAVTTETTYEFTTAEVETLIDESTEAKEIENPIPPVIFTDVNTEDWYYEAVTAMAQGGLVGGYGNNLFGPNDTLTIAQFCQILARAEGFVTGADESGYWAALAVKSCVDAGYIVTQGDVTRENYDKPITREMAVAAMYLAKKASLTENETKLAVTEIPDFDLISEQYKENILNAYKYGITNGVDEARTFDPQGLLTRGQVCQLFYNLNWTAPADTVDTVVGGEITNLETQGEVYSAD